MAVSLRVDEKYKKVIQYGYAVVKWWMVDK